MTNPQPPAAQPGRCKICGKRGGLEVRVHHDQRLPDYHAFTDDEDVARRHGIAQMLERDTHRLLVRREVARRRKS